jgi:hypothetical protein
MIGGIGHIVKKALLKEGNSAFSNAYEEFVYVINREYSRVFGSVESVLGDEFPFMYPNESVPSDSLEDWSLKC